MHQSNVPKLRFSGLFEPWERKKLKDAIKVIDGDRGKNYPKSDDLRQSGYCLFLSAKNVTKTGFDFRNCQFIDVEKDSLMRKGKLTFKDIVLTTRGTIGNIARYDTYVHYKNIRINSGMVILRALKSKLDYNFIYFFLNSPVSQKNIKRITFGSAQPQLTVKGINSLVLSYPALEEQKLIASFLSAVDSKIEKLTRKKELLEQYKKGVMQKLFSGEIRFKDENGNDYPDWKKRRIGDVVERIAVRNFQIKSSEIKETGLFKVVDQGKDEISGFSNQADKVLLNNGLIVYGDHTTIVKYIDFDFIVGADGVIALNANKENIKYLYYNICYNNIEPEGYKRHYSILKNVLLQLPTLEEQNKISAFLFSIDSKLKSMHLKIEKTKEFKKGLLQQMFV